MIINKYLFKNLLDFFYFFSIILFIIFILIYVTLILVAYIKSPVVENDFPTYASDQNCHLKMFDPIIKGDCVDKYNIFPNLIPINELHDIYKHIILYATDWRNSILFKLFNNKYSQLFLYIPLINFMILIAVFVFVPLIQSFATFISSLVQTVYFCRDLWKTREEEYKKQNNDDEGLSIFIYFKLACYAIWYIISAIVMWVLALFLIALYLPFNFIGNFCYYIGCLLQLLTDQTFSLLDTFNNYPNKNISYKNITICLVIMSAIGSAYDSFYENNNEDVFSGIAISGGIVLLLTIFNMINGFFKKN